MGDYGDQVQQAVREQIRAELGAKGLTQTDIMRMTGVGQNTLSRYLSDTLGRDIPLPVVAEVAKALGIGLSELIARSDGRRTGDGAY